MNNRPSLYCPRGGHHAHLHRAVAALSFSQGRCIAFLRAHSENLHILLKQMAQGNREAFAAFYTTMHPRLCRYLLRSFDDLTPEEAEDVASDALMIAWQQAPQYRGKFASASAQRWVITIARREVYRLQKAERRLTALENACGLQSANLWEEAIIAHDLVNRWRAFLASLSPREQEIARLRFQQGWTLAQIAAHFHLSKPRVHQILHRILARARHQLEIETP